MTETITFRPYLIPQISKFIFHTCLLIVLLYFWSTRGSWIYLAIAFILFITTIGYGQNLLFLQHVVIGEDKTITIRYWFGKGYTEEISKALYEILTKDAKIRSYRFNIQGNLYQVSPFVYKDGDDLVSILASFTKNKNINVKPTVFGLK